MPHEGVTPVEPPPAPSAMPAPSATLRPPPPCAKHQRNDHRAIAAPPTSPPKLALDHDRDKTPAAARPRNHHPQPALSTTALTARPLNHHPEHDPSSFHAPSSLSTLTSHANPRQAPRRRPEAHSARTQVPGCRCHKEFGYEKNSPSCPQALNRSKGAQAARGPKKPKTPQEPEPHRNQNPIGTRTPQEPEVPQKARGTARSQSPCRN